MKKRIGAHFFSFFHSVDAFRLTIFVNFEATLTLYNERTYIVNNGQQCVCSSGHGERPCQVWFNNSQKPER